MMKFMIYSKRNFLSMKMLYSCLKNLCLIILIRWHAKHAFIYFFTSWFIVNQWYFRFNNSNVLLTSKWFAWKSSWFCLNNKRRMKSTKTYQMFLKYTRSSFKRQFLFMHCAVASFFDEDCMSAFESFSFWVSKLRFINCDSTQWKRIRWASWSFFCSARNTMRSFKKRETKTSLIIAIFSTISWFMHFALSRKTKISFS